MTTKKEHTRIALVDDHKLMRHGIAELIEDFEGFTVVLEANNGVDFIETLKAFKEEDLPEIILMDIEMKKMDGYETTKWIKGVRTSSLHNSLEHKKVYENMQIVALSMNEKEFSIIEMLKSGASGYIFKDADPDELLEGLKGMKERGYYYSREANEIILNNLNKTEYHPNLQEVELLKWACTELTYKEIADKMFLSKRRIDGIREGLFEKLAVRSRIGLVIYAIQRDIYKIEVR
ncbi:MAG: two-component system invasion response regulator UvrY [Crocinitomix sp.]|jgi:two-component system invasion response regulator UvrY